ncbi:MAG: glycosyltransferase, partial [Pseudomonadota bacterium]|nr:glycosyltransferase [Pseudomonadota bacterium]
RRAAAQHLGNAPSREFPALGTFCAERARALSRYAEVRVLVPTPWFPSWLPARGGWRRWARVEREGRTAEGVPVVYPRYLSIPKVATWSQGIATAWSVGRAFRRRYGGWRPDVVDGHFAFPDGYAAVRLAQALGCRSLVTCHGSDLLRYPPLPITSAMLRWTLRTADRVISVSSALRDESVRLGCPADKAVFLTNGVDPGQFQVRDAGECRRRLDLPAERRIAVCVGYLIDRKNQSVLIRALAELRRQGRQPPYLVLVGEGPNLGLLQDEARRLGVGDSVRFVGQRPYDEIPYWIGAGDWLVLSSHYEGWATVYFEAMACGRPVLTSNVSAAPDAVSSSDYGIVVEPNTPAAFAQALRDAQASAFDPQRIRRYAEQHSWDNWARSLIAIIDSPSPPEGRGPG